MKIKISYFYQIRNFKHYQIPVSTAMWDPLWYHNNDKNQKVVYKDKNKVYNGLRFPKLSPRKIYQKNMCNGKEGVGTICNGDPESCKFMSAYRQYLKSLDFKEIYNSLNDLAIRIKNKEQFEEEPEIILIVHEPPTNLCSERRALIDLFKNNKVDCTEFC